MLCGNCGSPDVSIYWEPEAFCSTECRDEHEEKGCPLESDGGFREKPGPGPGEVVDGEIHRRCYECGKIKPQSEFGALAGRKAGVCLDCGGEWGHDDDAPVHADEPEGDEPAVASNGEWRCPSCGVWYDAMVLRCETDDCDWTKEEVYEAAGGHPQFRDEPEGDEADAWMVRAWEPDWGWQRQVVGTEEEADRFVSHYSDHPANEAFPDDKIQKIPLYSSPPPTDEPVSREGERREDVREYADIELGYALSGGADHIEGDFIRSLALEAAHRLKLTGRRCPTHADARSRVSRYEDPETGRTVDAILDSAWRKLANASREKPKDDDRLNDVRRKNMRHSIGELKRLQSHLSDAPSGEGERDDA